MAWLGPLLLEPLSPFAPLPAAAEAAAAPPAPPPVARSLSGLERAGGAGAAMVADEVDTSMGSTERRGSWCTGEERGTGLADVTDEESTGILRVEPRP